MACKNDKIQITQRNKKALREQILGRRNSISAEERLRKSALINEQLLGRITLANKTIAVYQAMGSEVSLNDFISAGFRAGAKICLPCMMKFSCMVFREISQRRYETQGIPFANNPIKSFEEGDPHLQEFPLVTPESLDVVIVPLVAFDREGNRLGYGGGNYDRFLSQLQKETSVIGIAFSEQRAEQISHNGFDQKLPLVISA